MTSSDLWDEETAKRYDHDSAEMFAPDVLLSTVDFLAELAGSGAALEFAVGTGRVAIPLIQRGVPVTGVELSPAMVGELRHKVDEATLPVTVGDMASATVAGEFSLVYLVWNSISNLCTQQEQVECFRNAARHLAPGGRFVIELWVPQLRRLPPGLSTVEMSADGRHRVVDTYDVVTQAVTSDHFWHEGEGQARHTSGTFRYIWPTECDLMAQLAGMVLEHRLADWNGTPFTAASESHVSVWRKESPDPRPDPWPPAGPADSGIGALADSLTWPFDRPRTL